MEICKITALKAALLLILFPANLLAQTVSSDSGAEFDVLLWPFSGGDEFNELTLSELEGAWFQSLIPRYIERELAIISPAQGDMGEYERTLVERSPCLVEAERDYALARGWLADNKYVLTLSYKAMPERSCLLIQASDPVRPIEMVGGIHYHAMIEILEREPERISSEAALFTFATPLEALLQLIVGAIDAALIPDGDLPFHELSIDRETFESHFSAREITLSPSIRGLWMKKELYDDLFVRTVILETWLRDRFADRLGWGSISD